MDFLLVGLVLLLLPVAVLRPFAGCVLYTVLSCLRPQNFVGGIALGARLSILVFAATAVGVILATVRRRERPRAHDAWFLLAALYVGAVLLSCRTAVFPALAWSDLRELAEIVLPSALTVALCDRPSRIRAVATAAALSLGAMAVLRVIDPVWDQGRLTGPGGKFRDSNDFALAMTMALPMLLCFRRAPSERWRRLALTLPIPFVLLAIVLTGSRGGFLALCSVGAGLALLGRRRWAKALAIPLAAAAFLAWAPSGYLQRMTTIRAYHLDSSARDRLSSWRVATRIARERPITGVGPGNFLAVYPRYRTDPRAPHVAHNSFLQLLAESGLPAALLFAALLGLAVVQTAGTARRASALRDRCLRAPARYSAAWRRLRGSWRPDRDRARRVDWIVALSQGLLLSLVAYLVGSQFLSRADMELVYLVTGIAGSLAVQARRELRAEAGPTPC